MTRSEQRTIVLVPGFMTDQDLWRDLVPHLSDLSILYADLNVGGTIEELAANILSKCPARFVLVGFSLGGYVARQMAYAAPERVEAQVLIATSARSGSPSTRTGNLDGQFKGLTNSAIRAAVHPKRAGDNDLISRIRRMGERLGPEVYLRLSSLQRSADLNALRRIQCPLLVVAAAEDRLRSIEESMEIVSATGAEFAVIEDCGHMIPLEQPVQLGHLIRDWLDKTLSRRGRRQGVQERSD